MKFAPHADIIRTPARACWGARSVPHAPCGPLWRVGRAHVKPLPKPSSPMRGRHHRRTNIATIIIVSTVVDVAMIPLPPSH
eukprot:5542447-Pyramimonas_sp.AAC.1